MEERIREFYFVLLRLIILLGLVIYSLLLQFMLAGASVKVLLLLAFFTAVEAGKELLERRCQLAAFMVSVVLFLILLFSMGQIVLLLGVYLGYELLTYLKPRGLYYLLPLLMIVVPVISDDAQQINLVMPVLTGKMQQIIIAIFLGIIYFQHNFVVESYRKQTTEDTMLEEELKHNMYRREHQMQEEVKKNFLLAQNQILEERAALSQTLHDKLGHTMNGSVYQLEAVKLLLEKDPDRSRHMLQAVIEQLRSGMDEIRAILRKERPAKYKIAMIQLEKLCEDCRKKGVMAELITEGDFKEIPENYLEVILDNAYEAVSNSMKYANCTKISIGVRVLNQLVRCNISDNGIGCEKFTDGMGIAGMRKRVREINGILDFETEAGFTINMLLPLKRE